MNALSALRSLAYPALRAEAPLKSGEAAALKNIPFTELETLSPGILPLDQTRAAGNSFENTIKNFVGEVAGKQAAAGEAVTGLLSGKNVSLHQAMIGMEEASISFQLMVEVRNKMLESYQELMRMQV
jgi:flagellar hook-basal body complex protein FliE